MMIIMVGNITEILIFVFKLVGKRFNIVVLKIRSIVKVL
jgi:hypothetical protein